MLNEKQMVFTSSESGGGILTIIIASYMAGISTATILTLWFVTSFRELDRKKKEVAAADEHVQMHRTIYMQVRGSPNAQAAKRMLDTSRVIYLETVKGYNDCVKNPIYRFPGFMMGFRIISETEP